MKRWVIVLTLVCLAPASRLARADDPALVIQNLQEDFQTTIQQLDEDTADTRKRISSLRAALKRLKRGKPVPGRPDLDLPCDCRPSANVGCDETFWTRRMGFSQSALGALAKQEVVSCVKIYEKFSGALLELPAACEERVIGKQGVDSKTACGVVRRMAEKKALEQKLADSEQKLKDIPNLKKEARAQLRELKKDLRNINNGSRANTQKTKTLPSEGTGADSRPAGDSGSAQ